MHDCSGVAKLDLSLQRILCRPSIKTDVMYGIAGLLAGRTLAGRYRIDAVVGRGGMGAVYRAMDVRLSRPVAIKVIGTAVVDQAEHQRLRARFTREARTAASLHHANVVQVHDFGTDPDLDLDYLVMELLQGEDLSAKLRAGPPTCTTSLSILRQAALGLAAGHRAGLVHRDVKPANLFLATDDASGEVQVKVLDFGIAQLDDVAGTVTQLTQHGRAPMSPAYASPEQLRGDSAITPASDVFSLGAVGYEMLTGTRLFASTDPRRVTEEVAAALHTFRERVPALDDRTYEVLVRGLSWQPADRFRDAGQLAEALAGFSPAAGTHTAPQSLPGASDAPATIAPMRADPAAIAPVRRVAHPSRFWEYLFVGGLVLPVLVTAISMVLDSRKANTTPSAIPESHDIALQLDEADYTDFNRDVSPGSYVAMQGRERTGKDPRRMNITCVGGTSETAVVTFSAGHVVIRETKKGKERTTTFYASSATLRRMRSDFGAQERDAMTASCSPPVILF